MFLNFKYHIPYPDQDLHLDPLSRHANIRFYQKVYMLYVLTLMWYLIWWQIIPFLHYWNSTTIINIDQQNFQRLTEVKVMLNPWSIWFRNVWAFNPLITHFTFHQVLHGMDKCCPGQLLFTTIELSHSSLLSSSES